MSDWWTYRPSDFLLFSSRVYERLVESHNVGLGSWRFAALALALLTLALVIRRRKTDGRVALGLAGAAAIWVAWSFLWGRYASINWAAVYGAFGFLAAGVAMAAVAALSRAPLRSGGSRSIGAAAAVATVAFATVAYPFAEAALGRKLAALEFAGIMPDPTAIALLGVAALVRSSWAAIALAAVPALWAAYAAMTLFTLGAPEAWLATAGLAAGLASFCLRRA